MKYEAQPLSTGFCRMLVLASAVLVSGYGLFLSLGSNTGFPDRMHYASQMPYLADKPLGEDAFYMFHVAWNLASGNGPVCNEGTVVTGIQPLATLAYAGLAWLDIRAGGDKWMLLRLVLLLNLVLLLVFAELVGRIAAAISTRRKIPAYCLGFLLSVFSFAAFRLFTFGLETGMYLTAFAATILFSLRHIPAQTPRDIVVLGLLGGLCGWCRIDFGICFAVFLLAMLFGRVLTLKQCLVSGSLALLILAPWFIWVCHVSGSPMPSSGNAECELIRPGTAGLRLELMASALIENLAPWFYTSGQRIWVVAKGLSLLLCLTALVVGRRKLRGARCGGRVWRGWVLAILTLAPVYLFCFWSMHFYIRYTSPLLILTSAFFAVSGVELAANILDNRRGMLAAGGVLCSVFAALAVGTLHNHRSLFGYAVTAGFVQQNLSQVSRVGAFQSGTIGFFNPNVVNLDGKVNAAVLPFIRDRKLTEYIERSTIGAIIDWPWCIQRLIPNCWMENGWLETTQNLHSAYVKCYLRKNGAKEKESP